MFGGSQFTGTTEIDEECSTKRYTSQTKLFINNVLFDRDFGDIVGYNSKDYSSVKRDRAFNTNTTCLLLNAKSEDKPR